MQSQSLHPNRLHQLVSNLLQNSTRYTDGGGTCRVKLEERNDGFYLEIEDSAPAVPEDALPRLFDRLYRVESSRNRATGGAGLGLTRALRQAVRLQRLVLVKVADMVAVEAAAVPV